MPKRAISLHNYKTGGVRNLRAWLSHLPLMLALACSLQGPGCVAAESRKLLEAEAAQLVGLVSPPASPDSEEERAELEAVLRAMETCDPVQKAQAEAEEEIQLSHFSAQLGPLAEAGQLPGLVHLIETLTAEARLVNGRAKQVWKRLRPAKRDPRIQVQTLEMGYSYPSGHACRGLLHALVLAELFPQQRDALLERGRQLGWHRVQIGVHYPSDVTAGRMLAQALFETLKTKPEFLARVAQLKAEIAAYQRLPAKG